MIDIRTVNGEAIDLLSKEITIELNNSLFQDAAQFKGSFSYPISLAMSPNNIRLFGFAHQLETSIKQYAIPVWLRIGSLNFKRAMLSLSANAHAFEAHLKLGIDSLNLRIRTTKVTSLAFPRLYVGGLPASISEQMLAAAKNTDWKKIPYSFFPMLNPDFVGKPKNVGSIASRPISLINEMRLENNLCTFDIRNFPSHQQGPIVPCFYLAYMLTEIARCLGYSLQGDFLEHPDVQKMVIYNVNSAYLSRVQASDAAKGAAYQRMHGLTIAAHEHLPGLTIADFFKALSSYFSCHIWLDERRATLDISWKKSVFTNRKQIDWSEKMIRVEQQTLFESGGYTLSAEVEKTAPKDAVVFGQGKTKLAAPVGTLDFVEESLPERPDLSWCIPVDQRPGNISDPLFADFENYTATAADRKDFPLRFLFFHGLSDGIKYPRCSAQGHDFELRMSGSKGLFEFAQRPWLEQIHENKRIQVKLKLQAIDLNQLQDPQLILLKSANGARVECLLQKMTFTIAVDQSHILADATLVVLNSVSIENAEPPASFLAQQPLPPPVFLRLVIVSKDGMNGYHEMATSADVFLEAYADALCTMPIQTDHLLVEYAEILTAKTRFYDSSGKESALKAPLETQERKIKRISMSKTHRIQLESNCMMRTSSYSHRSMSESGGLMQRTLLTRSFCLEASENYRIVLSH